MKILIPILIISLLVGCADPMMEQAMRMPDGPAKYAALQAARADSERRKAEVNAAVMAGLAGAAAGIQASRPIYVVPAYYPFYYY